jgi:hypothetical protein
MTTHPTREQAVSDHLVRSGLPQPKRIIFPDHQEPSLAVEFIIGGVVETFEGCGASDTERADDVGRQYRVRKGLPNT